MMLPVLASLAVTKILDVSSDSKCPTAVEIETRVRAILDPKGDRHLDEKASVHREGDRLRVSLQAADGHAIDERVLAAHASCDELAHAVAVVLSAWLSDVHPEYVGALPQPPAPPVQPIAPPPANPVTADVAAEEARTSPAFVPREIVEARPPVTSGSDPRHIEVGVALGVGVSGSSGAAVGSLMLAWVAPSSGFGWSMTMALAWPRERPLEAGAVRWWRWPVGTGPVLRIPAGWARVDLGLGGALSWLHLSGRDFPNPHSAEDFTFGTLGSVRVAGTTGKVVPFAAVTGCWWFAASQAYVNPSGDQLDLPRYDFFVVAGGALRP